MSSSANELENYKIQLQQVEAALIAEPENEELLKLKVDLNEIIQLQQELIGADSAIAPISDALSSSVSSKTERLVWKVGDRCLAAAKSGQKQLAVIDGISQDKVAITFANTGKKDMVRLQDLAMAPVEEKKKYIFQTGKQGGPKKEWHLERERRKARAQKKEQRRKQLDEQKEVEKNKWKSFNVKANAKNMKGLKQIPSSSSAGAGTSRNASDISSRRNTQAFGATQRGNMESLF